MIVFVHPLGSDPSFFSSVRAHLSDLESAAVELSEAADSVGPEPTLEQLTDWVAEWVRARWDDPVTIVGVSLGGLIAMDLAARHSELVERLVVCDSVAAYPEGMVLMWTERAARVREHGLSEFLAPTLELWFSDSFRARQSEGLQNMIAVFGATDPEYYARMCEVLAGADLRGLAPSISAETMVVCGAEDAPAFVEAATWLHTAIPSARLEWIAGARHAAALECPRQIAALIRAAQTPTSTRAG